jgi:hypothetical protein
MYNEPLKTERKDGVEVISHEAGVEVISYEAGTCTTTTPVQGSLALASSSTALCSQSPCIAYDSCRQHHAASMCLCLL